MKGEIMNLSKTSLAKYGVIAGLAFIVLFILSMVFKNHGSSVMHWVFWIPTVIVWIFAVVIGILIIVEALKETAKTKPQWWILFLIGGIMLIIFPVIGAILLFISLVTNLK